MKEDNSMYEVTLNYPSGAIIADWFDNFLDAETYAIEQLEEDTRLRVSVLDMESSRVLMILEDRNPAATQ